MGGMAARKDCSVRWRSTNSTDAVMWGRSMKLRGKGRSGKEENERLGCTERTDSLVLRCALMMPVMKEGLQRAVEAYKEH